MNLGLPGKLVLRTCGALIALSLAGIFAVSAASGAGALELNAEGLSRFNRGDYPGAVESFRQAATLLPGDQTLKQNLIQALNGWGVKLGSAEQFEDAMAQLQEALKLDPDQAAVRSNLATLRINYATRLADKKKYDEATRLLLEAYETAPGDAIEQIDERRASILVLEAREALEKKQTARGQALLTKALQIQPVSVPAMLELADLLYEKGENQAALDYYLEAHGLDPEVKGLQERISKIQREQNVEAGFARRSNNDFTLSYEDSVSPEATRTILDILWDARRAIGRELKFYPERKIPVVVYTQTQYAAATDAPEWSGAIFDGKIRVPLPRTGISDGMREQLRTTLFHEFTHALLHELVPGQKLPAWLNEGIACYYESERDARARRDELDRRRLRGLLNEGRLVPVSRLPDSFTSIADKGKAEEAYVTSRSFTMWLANRYRPARLRSLIDEVNRGTPIDDAFATVYRKPLAELEKEWAAELRG